MNTNIIKNSVVQINENGQDGWIGCFIQVDEVEGFGVMGWVQIPKGGQAYIFVTWEQIDYIGQAIMI